MPQTIFRVVLDTPYSFAVEPGYSMVRYCQDFRPNADDLSPEAYHDPVTGLVTLRPSHLTDDWYNDNDQWWPLTDWQLVEDFWTTAHRAFDPDGAYTTTGPRFIASQDPGTTGGLVGDFTDLGIYGVSLASVLATDVVSWVGQSKNDLLPDEGFVLHWQTIGDRFHRVRNWFALQWGGENGIQLHFSMDGTVRCYRHVTGKANEPELFDTFQIADAGDLIGKEGYFSFIPYPAYGLAVYHSNLSQRISSKVSSAQAGVTRGHLIRLPDTDTGDGLQLLSAGPVTIGINRSLRRMQHLWGFHRIRYQTSGTFLDQPFDPGYVPTAAPDVYVGLAPTAALARGDVGVLASCRKADDPAALWDPIAGTEQGRVLHTLSTRDRAYTPALAWSNPFLLPVFSERNTTPVYIAHEGPDGALEDRLFRLEFTDDEKGRFEGEITIQARTYACKKIIERGDMTFELQKSTDGGDTWTVHAGGLARVKGDFEVNYFEGMVVYDAVIEMADMYARFAEITQISQQAFDGMTPQDAINSVLSASGQPQLSYAPLELDTIKMPPIQKGQPLRFAPQMGDSGTDIIHDILLLCRRQNLEYRMIHDWAANQWSVRKKPRDTSEANTWVFTPFDDEAPGGYDEVTGYVRIGQGRMAGKFSVSPPEANLIQPYGLDSIDPNEANRVPGNPIVNYASLTNVNHPDYLGRIVRATPMLAGLAEVADVNRMGRRIYDSACHRRIQGAVPGTEYIDDLKPLSFVRMRTYDEDGNRTFWNIRTQDLSQPANEEGEYPDIIGFWVKKRHVVKDFLGRGRVVDDVTYHVDTRWEGDLK